MGRQPKPAAVKKAEGNPGKRKIPQEVQPAAEAPVCPSYFSKRAVKIWNDTTKQLEVMGLLFRADEQLLSAYVMACEDLVDSEETLQKQGRYIEDSYGNKKRHPAAVTRDKATAAIAKLGSLLGLNAISRARLALQKGKEEDEGKKELEAFLQKSKEREKR